MSLDWRRCGKESDKQKSEAGSASLSRKGEGMIKALLMIYLCAFTLYSPLELSRLIFTYGLSPVLIFELCFIWVFYAIFVGILAKVIRT